MAKTNPVKLTRTELKAGLEALGLELSEEDKDHVIGICDYDNSGTVEFDEFITLFGTGQVLEAPRDTESLPNPPKQCIRKPKANE